MTKGKRTEKFARAGYRVHFDRLKNIRAEASFIRTHKFKCAVPYTAEESLKEYFEKVAHVVDSNNEGSILWFLTQLYGLGFLFVPKEGKKLELLNLLYPEKNPPEIEHVINQLLPETRHHIKDTTAFWNFITTTPREVYAKIQDNTLPGGIIIQLGAIFEPSTKINADNLADFPIVKKWHDKLLQEAIKHKGLKEKNIQDCFGVKPEVRKTEGTTFVLQPLTFAEIRQNSQQPIDIYTAYFSYLLPSAQKTGKKVQSLMGVDENQNALSNLLGKSLKAFRKSTADCKKLLEYANPIIAEESPEQLDLLANTVHELAKKITPAAEIDFFKQNWGDYRNLVGGRLEGWISNFEKRLEAYSKNLASDGKHQKIFELIEKNCDVENIFDEKQKQNLDQLKRLRPSIYESLQQNLNNREAGGDIGKLIAEYTTLLDALREYLMKWNNEGIPAVINGKEVGFYGKNTGRQTADASYFLNVDNLCENQKKKAKKKGGEGESQEEKELKEGRRFFWSKDAVPAELEKYPRFIGEAQKDPEEEVKKAQNQLLGLAQAGQAFVRAARKGNEAESEFLQQNWIEGRNLYYKNLETLKKIAFRSKNPARIWQFFEQEIIDWQAKKGHRKSADLEAWWRARDDSKSGHRKFLRFHVSGYERFEYTEMPVKKIGFDDFLELFSKHFELEMLESQADFVRFFGLEQEYPNIENGELLKIYWSLCLRDLNESVLLPEMQAEFEILTGTSLSTLLFNGKSYRSGIITLPVLQRFVQASIGSEIRAKLSILSRTGYIERNVIQTTNGEQSFLQYIPLEWGAGDETVDGESIREQIAHLQEEMKSVRGKNPLHYKQLKRKARRLRLASRPLLQKLKKTVYHLERDIEEFSEQGLQGGTLAALQKRKEVAQKKIDDILQGKSLYFSEDAIIRLNSVGIEFEDKTNKEIVHEIWTRFPKTTAPQKQAMAKVLGEIPHRWAMVLKTKSPLPFLKEQEVSSGFFIEKSDGKSVWNFCTKKSGCFLYSLPLETSKVQKQFLEKFLWENSASAVSEKILGSTVIIEDKKHLRQVANSDPSRRHGDFSVFWAVPFQFQKGGLAIKKGFQYRENDENILGIDLGEYGFGWAVFNPKTQQFLAQEFQTIPLLQQMRESASAWQDTQSKGIFSRPTTHLADVREQAAGETRNQIHALALRYGAKPVYEDSVDGFEEGGQKIKKLYKTLKTADVIGGNSNAADKAVRHHFWGVDYASIGGVIGAAKTSQTCRVCGRCATTALQDMPKDWKGNVLDKVLELESGLYGRVSILCESLGDGEYDRQELFNAIKAGQRKENPHKPERGKDAQFICRFADCDSHAMRARGEVIDSDEQAAMNIALKYFFRHAPEFEEERDEIDSAGKKVFYDEKTGIFSSLKYFLEKSQQPEWREL